MHLHTFLTSNRQQIIDLCHDKVTKRSESIEATAAIDNGVPLFLEQLVETLKSERNTPIRSTDAARTPAPTDIGRAAALHGAEMLHRGFSVDQVVHEYGDVCQCVTALAVEQSIAISTDEFRTLNRCLDNAIADAVAAFGAIRQSILDRQAESGQQRLDAFAIEHGRLIEIAINSFKAIKTGNIGTAGATGVLLDYALEELRTLTERFLPEALVETPRAAAAAK